MFYIRFSTSWKFRYLLTRFLMRISFYLVTNVFFLLLLLACSKLFRYYDEPAAALSRPFQGVERKMYASIISGIISVHWALRRSHVNLKLSFQPKTHWVARFSCCLMDPVFSSTFVNLHSLHVEEIIQSSTYAYSSSACTCSHYGIRSQAWKFDVLQYVYLQDWGSEMDFQGCVQLIYLGPMIIYQPLLHSHHTLY